MRVLIVLAALQLFICDPAQASEWSREVTYAENHDPGAIWFSDNTQVHVEFAEIPWATVNAWPQGKALRLEWSVESGTELVDIDNHKRMRAVIDADDVHPIDLLAEQCMQRPPFADAPCLDAAYEHWDREVARTYHELLKRTAAKSDRDRLRVAQRNWTRFRDSQTAAIEQIIGGRDGTVWPNVSRRECNRLMREQHRRLQHMSSLSAPESDPDL